MSTIEHSYNAINWTADDREFISRLINFGLSEKKAWVYLQLLRYGPKPLFLLAKSLNTYRGDVFRTLASLVDKGIVNRSIKSPTVYVAMGLNIALDVALKKLETELHEMEFRKQEIEVLSNQHLVTPSSEFCTFKILKCAGEVVTTALSTLKSIEREWIAVIPAIIISFFIFI